MCGIFGVIAHSGVQPEARTRVADALNLMAVMSSDRGTDACGVAVVSQQGEARIYKDVVDSLAMTRRSHWRDLVLSADPGTHVILGHTRKKSQGQNTLENAHPFDFTTEHGVLVGTHNGTLYTHERYKQVDPYDSDSRNFFHYLAERPREAWREVFAEISGTYAMVITRNDRVYLARNYGSPCFTAFCSEEGLTFYASTERTLVSGLLFGRFDTTYVSELVSYQIYEYQAQDPRTIKTLVPLSSTFYAPGSYNRYNRHGTSTPTPPPPAPAVQTCAVCKNPTPSDQGIRTTSCGFTCTSCYSLIWADESQ